MDGWMEELSEEILSTPPVFLFQNTVAVLQIMASASVSRICQYDCRERVSESTSPTISLLLRSLLSPRSLHLD